MNCGNFKCFLALFSFILGLLSAFFAYVILSPSSPTFILFIIISICLLLYGFKTFLLQYHHHQIVAQLKTNQLPLLARWDYHPRVYTQVQRQLEDDRYIMTSTVVLIGICILFTCLGTLFIPNPSSITFAIFSTFCIMFITSICILSIFSYYEKKINTSHETLISNDFIYFKSELYTFEKSFYFLENVDIVFDEQHYLQFTYGAPGTPFGPFHVLSIPIPHDEIITAYKIKAHFLSIIQETIDPQNE